MEKTYRLCNECGHKLEGYAPNEIFCGACYAQKLEIPCDECGADAGENCTPFCTSLEGLKEEVSA